MFFDINADSAIPIYEQIVSQMIYGIAAGGLKPGEMIPSVRDLAGRILVNPNTVAKAISDLERRGIVVSRRGRGMEVTGDGPKICKKLREEIVRNRIRNTLKEAALALPAKEIRQLVDEELANGEYK